MDENTLPHLPYEGKRCEPTKYENSSLPLEIFKVMQSLQKYVVT